MSAADVVLPLVVLCALFVAIVSAKAAERAALQAEQAAERAEKAADDMHIRMESARRRGLL